jgi:hypothetical protein
MSLSINNKHKDNKEKDGENGDNAGNLNENTIAVISLAIVTVGKEKQFEGAPLLSILFECD